MHGAISSDGLVPSDKMIDFLHRLCKNFISYAYLKFDLIFQVVPIGTNRNFIKMVQGSHQVLTGGRRIKDMM